MMYKLDSGVSYIECKDLLSHTDTLTTASKETTLKSILVNIDEPKKKRGRSRVQVSIIIDPRLPRTGSHSSKTRGREVCKDHPTDDVCTIDKGMDDECNRYTLHWILRLLPHSGSYLREFERKP
jgi:hypothetical protein